VETIFFEKKEVETMKSYIHLPLGSRPIHFAYQPPVNNTFLSEQTSHQQPTNSTFLSEQTNHQNKQAEEFRNLFSKGTARCRRVMRFVDASSSTLLVWAYKIAYHSPHPK
jgi:hypothetical protein